MCQKSPVVLVQVFLTYHSLCFVTSSISEFSQKTRVTLRILNFTPDNSSPSLSSGNDIHILRQKSDFTQIAHVQLISDSSIWLFKRIKQASQNISQRIFLFHVNSLSSRLLLYTIFSIICNNYIRFYVNVNIKAAHMR